MNFNSITKYLYNGMERLIITNHELSMPFVLQYKSDDYDDLYNYILHNYDEEDIYLDYNLIYDKETLDYFEDDYISKIEEYGNTFELDLKSEDDIINYTVSRYTNIMILDNFYIKV